MPIIPNPGAGGQAFGGILHLPDAFLRHPEADFLTYNRVSSLSGAGGISKAKLDEKTNAVTDAVVAKIIDLIAEAEGPVSWEPVSIIDGVEEGRPSAKRPALLQAFEIALKESLNRRRPVIVVASDLSRFIRSEAYHCRDNPEALVTAEEFAWLNGKPPCVILATLEPPWLTEAERNSKAQKRRGKSGRPPTMDDDLAMMMLKSCGPARGGSRLDCHSPKLPGGYPRGSQTDREESNGCEADDTSVPHFARA